MSVDKVFKRRKGALKIPVEDVAKLVRLAGYIRETAAIFGANYDFGAADSLQTYAAELDFDRAAMRGKPV